MPQRIKVRHPPPPPPQDTQGCNFFAWDRMTGYCWLKRTDGLRIPHPKMIIGPKFCANMASNPHTPTPKEACTVTATQVRMEQPRIICCVSCKGTRGSRFCWVVELKEEYSMWQTLKWFRQTRERINRS